MRVGGHIGIGVRLTFCDVCYGWVEPLRTGVRLTFCDVCYGWVEPLRTGVRLTFCDVCYGWVEPLYQDGCKTDILCPMDKPAA